MTRQRKPVTETAPIPETTVTVVEPIASEIDPQKLEAMERSYNHLTSNGIKACRSCCDKFRTDAASRYFCPEQLANCPIVDGNIPDEYG